MLAFASDPVMRWAWPDAHRYATYWPKFAEAFGGQAFDDGTAYGLADCLAVALWMRPGVLVLVPPASLVLTRQSDSAIRHSDSARSVAAVGVVDHE